MHKLNIKKTRTKLPQSEIYSNLQFSICQFDDQQAVTVSKLK